MTGLTINERYIGDVTVLNMDGKVTIGESSVVLHNTIRNLLEQGRKKILLNLAGVPFIDLSGLGELEHHRQAGLPRAAALGPTMA